MTNNHDPNDENFVMSEENAPQEENDDREEYFEVPAARMNLRSHLPIIVGAVGLILVALIAWLFLSGGGAGNSSYAVEKFDSRLTQLEEKLAKLEWLDQGLARLDKQEKDFAALTEKIKKMEASYKRELAKITKDVDKIDRKAATINTRQQTPSVTTGKSSSATVAKVHVVKAGDTLYGISRKYSVELDELRQQNDLTTKSRIFPGQKLTIP